LESDQESIDDKVARINEMAEEMEENIKKEKDY
jgi:hypothetical protein